LGVEITARFDRVTIRERIALHAFPSRQGLPACAGIFYQTSTSAPIRTTVNASLTLSLLDCSEQDSVFAD
jgi:hypothetical protein